MAGRTALWHPSFPHIGLAESELGGPSASDDLAELFAYIEQGDTAVEAHNAFFERGIWANISVPRHGWPAIRSEQWRCSAAKAAALALPRSLEDAGHALNLPVRKGDDSAMKKMAKPRKAVKAEWDAWGREHAPCVLCAATGKVDGINPETGRKKKQPCGRCSGRGWMGQREDLPPMPTLWHETRELFEELFAYCRQDVLAEECLSEAIPDLPPSEQEMYQLDQEINEHGFALDVAAIDLALELVEGENAGLNAELTALSGGRVTRATQRAKLKAWLADEGLELEDTRADTIDAMLERPNLPGVSRRALEILQSLAKSSTAKYETMRDWVCPDGRVRGGLLYHGASTGRWTGKGVQPHNFPRGDYDAARKYQKDPEFIWACLESRDPEFICYEYGSVMNALSNGLRGVIIAGE